MLLISHRLANVVSSDEIYVLANGAVAEHGTHSKLLQAGGVYAALWSSQQALEHYGEEVLQCKNEAVLPSWQDSLVLCAP